jgi:hypothetical protein
VKRMLSITQRSWYVSLELLIDIGCSIHEVSLTGGFELFGYDRIRREIYCGKHGFQARLEATRSEQMNRRKIIECNDDTAILLLVLRTSIQIEVFNCKHSNPDVLASERPISGSYLFEYGATTSWNPSPTTS